MQTKALLAFALFLNVLNVNAETFKCTQNGKFIISDTPCMAGASRVDTTSDAVSQEQRRQAEQVNQRNRRQLSELEHKAAQDRATRGSLAVFDNTLPSQTPPQRR